MDGIYTYNKIDPARMAFLRLLAERQTQEASEITDYRSYYDGDHAVSLTQRQRAFLGLKAGRDFSENYCQMVVDSLAERLVVTGFTTGQPELDAVLWDWWTTNRMDGQAGLVHTWAARDKAAFVVVGWDNAARRPTFHVNEAFDGDEGVKVFWRGRPGAGGAILFASKRWREEGIANGDIETFKRMNLYLPDAILKYRSGADVGDWGWKEMREAGEAWPDPWTDDGAPIGVPVVAFLNKRTGVSELANVIPLQDAINKALVDIIAACDMEGFGIYTKTGGAKVESVKVFPGAFWQDTDPQAQFGKIAGSQLAGLLETHDTLVKTLAIVTRRPLRDFTGGTDAVSGESKKQDEAGLVSQAKDATVHFGNSWEDVMYLAATLDRVFGDGRIPPGTKISAQWGDVETRNEDAHRTSVREDFRAGIIDQEQAWTELGYSQETQAAMLRRQAAKQAQALATAVKLIQAPAPVQQPEGAEEPQDEAEDEDTE